MASQFGITETKGVLVSDVMDDSPAKKAGFERADVIVEYDGKSMDSPTHLRNAVAQTPIGKKVSVKFIRDKKPKTIDLTIVEQPKSLGQSGAEERENRLHQQEFSRILMSASSMKNWRLGME